MYSRIIPGRLDRRSGTRNAFNGSFASLFPGAYQVLQSDRGLTYGGTPLAAAGNTSTTVLTLTGTLATAPVPIRVKATNTAAVGSATFDISLDGGASFSSIGTPPTAGVPAPLTGAATGLSLTWSAGNSVINDTWNATAAASADQSGNAKDFTQANPAKQMVVTVGLNGKAALLWDGVDDVYNSALTMPANPVFDWKVWRKVTEPSGISLHCGGIAGLSHVLNCPGVATTLSTFASGGGNTVNITLNQWMRTEAYFSNSASDYTKAGSGAPVSGTNAGAAATTAGYQIGNCVNVAGRFSNMELLIHALMPYLPSAGQLAAANAAVSTYYAGLVAI